MRIRRFAALGALAATLATVACSPPPTTPTTTRERVDLPSECPDGAPTVAPKSVRALNRSSRLIAPANYQPGVKYPLLVSLHPFVLDGEAWENYSGLGAAASTRGYWVLVPTGSQPGPRWAVPGGLDTKIDDIAWIEALIQSTAHTVCVDGGRVFAAGFSAGAAMSVGLSCELPWRFTAIAASGGSNLTSLCPDSDPVDALILHGSADGWAPVTGSEQVFATPMGLHVDRAQGHSHQGRDLCPPQWLRVRSDRCHPHLDHHRRSLHLRRAPARIQEDARRGAHLGRSELPAGPDHGPHGSHLLRDHRGLGLLRPVRTSRR